MENTMKVHYKNGEVETYEVEFDVFDVESLMIPEINALIIEKDDKKIFLMLDNVKKLEFININED